MMKRILVTGSNGLLGQKVVEMLAARKGCDVVATSFSDNTIIQKEGYLFELLDVTNPVEISYVFDKYKPDTVIHTAALTEVSRCEQMKDDAWRINVEGTGNITREANKSGAHLVFLSSDFVFDGMGGPYQEADQPNPLNHYGATKLEAEKLVQKHSASWTILRTCLVYGVNFIMSRPNFLLWVKHSLENGERIRVNNDQFRTPTFADDLAEACIMAAEHRKQGIFHIAGDEYLKVIHFAHRIADHYKLDKEFIDPVSSSELHETGRRPMRTGLANERAREELGFLPKSLDRGIELVDSQAKTMGKVDD